MYISRCYKFDFTLCRLDLCDSRSSGLYASAEFSPDLTPLHVAAHNEHFQAIELLLQQGCKIPVPHPPYCKCHVAVFLLPVYIY